MGERSFFGLQVVVRGEEGLADKLRPLVAGGAARQSPNERRAVHERLGALVEPLAARAVWGYWDYVPAGRQAAEEFDWWRREIEAEPAAPPPPGLGGPYLWVSLQLLLRGGSPADLRLGELCDLPAARWWRRDTVVGLLQAASAIDFTEVEAEAIFLCPGRLDRGLRGREIALGFAHLRRLG